MIKVDKVTYCYPGQANPVLEDVDLQIQPGEIVAVIGPNGSGKSTLGQLLNGIILPAQGRIQVDGLDTGDEDAIWQVRQKVGLILQNPDNQLVAPVVEEDVAFGPENLGVESSEIRLRVTDSLRKVNFSQYAKWPPNRLSGGQKQKVAIAGILAMKPDYIVFDEATSMLDPRGRRELLQILLTLRANGTGIVIITHHMNEAALADRILLLVKGKLVLSGAPVEVFNNPELAQHGLEAPAAVRIAKQLRLRGLKISEDILHVEELVKALC